jgi:hypothetical protein
LPSILLEAHALVLTCTPNEARGKIKITHADGVKGLTWIADGATSSGAPVISGTSSSRVVAPWSAAAADRLAPGPAADSARRPSFGVDELARLLHALADPRMSTARLLCERRNREDLDGQPECKWTDHIAPLFDDPHIKPDRITELSKGVAASDIATVDPSLSPFERDGSSLSARYAELRSTYAVKLRNFQESGQGDDEGFPRFAAGNAGITYGHCLFNTGEGSLVADISTRLMPQCIQQVEGVQASAGGGIDAAGRRTRRRRDSAHASSEIVVRGMENIERVDPEAEAPTVRSEAAAAELAKSIVRGKNLDSLL